MTAYYNEIDPFAAAWLRELISAGHIAPGEVDERSIEDVKPTELTGFTQCHFFAGIGGWSLALRQAGWPDEKPVWTGSCPCQPFSAAGKGGGFDDERHLWPAFQWLIQQCRPATIFGEQVASKATNPWFDLVQTDLEALGYAFGSIPFPAAGVGAPHIRDRNYWVGHSIGAGLEGFARHGHNARGRERPIRPVAQAGSACEFCGYEFDVKKLGRYGCPNCEAGGMADTDSARPQQGRTTTATAEYRHTADANGSDDRPSPTNGHWRDADWLLCRDGKWRPVEPGTFPLANGVSNRVGKLRGYGNAIVPTQAAIFIEATGL